jgi:putative ABC transport system permease protein
MASPRWRKLRGDLAAMPGRLIAMVIALAVSLVGFGAVLGARTVLRREIAVSYLASHPADATLVLDGDVDRTLLAELRARPEIADADAREVVQARIAPGEPAEGRAAVAHVAHFGHAAAGDARSWQALELFVVDDFAALRLHTLRRESGAWPPPTGAMLVERSAVDLLGVGEGATATVKTPHGEPRPIAVAGVVHDTSVAPAWQERRGYGYIARETLAALGEPPVLHELGVTFRPSPATREDAEAAASSLARTLNAGGHAVRQIRVPPLREHPHQAQMTTAQMVLLLFSVLLLVLSAILIATLVGAMLARQVREIGVMKAVGARTGQLAAMYAAAVALVGAAACAIALPLGALGAHAMIGGMSMMMNLALADTAIPAWVFVAQAAAGIAVPLAIAAAPILRACRRTVRDALAQYGASAERIRPSLTRLPMAARDALRRPAQLALTLALLITGGVLSSTAFNVKRAYEANIERMPRMWHHDLDIRLSEPAAVALAAQLAALHGIRIVEPWGFAMAASARDGTDVVRTYPDQGHGAFPVWGVPVPSRLIDLPLVEGRWLAADDRDAMVVSSMTNRHVGETLDLSLRGVPSRWRVVGVVDTVPAGGGYVTDAAFARATHTEGLARTLRVATSAVSRDELHAITAAIEREITDQGARVDAITSSATMRDAMDAHVFLLVRAAIVLSAIVALVGLLGLGAAIGISVLSRTREIAMMKAVGATNPRIFRLVLGEAALVAVASGLVSAALTLPVTAAVDSFLSRLGFLSATFVVSPGALAGWLVAVVLGSLVAALAPARRAARLTVREALTEA